MPYCAVPGCLNGSRQGVKPDIKWFCFPKERDRADLWWQKIKRDGRLSDVKDPRVCSEHFVSDDFQRDLKYELLYPGSPLPLSKVRLSDTACPSKNIPSSHPAR